MLMEYLLHTYIIGTGIHIYTHINDFCQSFTYALSQPLDGYSVIVYLQDVNNLHKIYKPPQFVLFLK